MLLFYMCQKYNFFVLKRSLVTFIILHGSSLPFLRSTDGSEMECASLTMRTKMD